MKVKTIVLATIAVAAVVDAKKPPSDGKDFNKQGKTKGTITDGLSCFKCQEEGGEFYSTDEAGALVVDPAAATTKCCDPSATDAECPERDDSTMKTKTADQASDITVGASLCPNKKSTCGTKKNMDFDKEGDTETIEIGDMAEGETCTYQIKAKCGGPYFKMDKVGGSADDKLSVSYYEYNDDDVTTEKGSDGSTYPKKDQAFADAGYQEGNQSTPAMKTDTGKERESTEYGAMKEDGDGLLEMVRSFGEWITDLFTSKEKQAEYEPLDNTGAGKPTQGQMPLKEGDSHSFGSLGAGDSTQGFAGNGENTCQDRTMEVTITAYEDMTSSDAVEFTFGTDTFVNSQWLFEGATSLTLVAASTAAAVSASLY